MTQGRLKFWGWGREDVVLSADEIARLEGAYAKRFGLSGYDVTPTPRRSDRCVAIDVPSCPAVVRPRSGGQPDPQIFLTPRRCGG